MVTVYKYGVVVRVLGQVVFSAFDLFSMESCLDAESKFWREKGFDYECRFRSAESTRVAIVEYKQGEWPWESVAQSWEW